MPDSSTNILRILARFKWLGSSTIYFVSRWVVLPSPRTFFERSLFFDVKIHSLLFCRATCWYMDSGGGSRNVTSSIVNAPYRLTSSEANPCLSFAMISVARSLALGPPEVIDVFIVVFIMLELWPPTPRLPLKGFWGGGLLKPIASGWRGAAGLWKD